MTRSGRFVAAVAAAAVLLLTLILFGPLDIYLGNPDEFSVGFAAALGHALLPAAGAALTLALLALATGARGFEWCVSLYLAVTAAAYLQGKLVVWDYGLLDGSAIAWDDYPLRSLIDVAMWLVVIGTCLHARQRVAAHATSIAALLVVAQAASVAPALLSDGPGGARSVASNLDSIHRFSSERNVVVLLLDGFQSTAFEQVIESEPEWQQVFDGFTWFRDATAPFPTTKLSLPAILSGALYDNSVSMSAFLSSTLPERSLPSRLHERGYWVDLTTRARFCPLLRANSCAELAPLIARDPHRLEQNTLVQLMDVSLFRQAPQSLKRVLFADQEWWLRSWWVDRPGPRFHVESIEFVEALEANAQAGAGAPSFKLFHLLVPHMPVRLDAKCRHLPATAASPGSDPRAGYVEQSRCALELARRLLALLERLGVYDRTMVVVLADHGVDLDWGLPQVPGYPNPGPALPLLLVKPFGSHGGLERSDAPATIADVPRTIAAALGLGPPDARFPGRRLFELAAGERRRRIHRDYQWKRSHWWGLHIDHMTEYVIDGQARDGRNWTRGRELPALAAP